MKPSSFNERVFCAAIGFMALMVALLICADRVKRVPSSEQASARPDDSEILR